MGWHTAKTNAIVQISRFSSEMLKTVFWATTSFKALTFLMTENGVFCKLF